MRPPHLKIWKDEDGSWACHNEETWHGWMVYGRYDVPGETSMAYFTGPEICNFYIPLLQIYDWVPNRMHWEKKAENLEDSIRIALGLAFELDAEDLT